MAQPRSRNNKRARADEEATKEEDQDVRLGAALRALLGGSKYVKQSELSREVLLSYAIQKGDVVPVTLFTVTVQNFGGSIFDVRMEEKQNSVKQLKLLIQEEQGTPLSSQALFLLPKSGKTEEASEFPMTDEYLIEGSCSVVISVQAPAIAWAKSGTGISITDDLVIKNSFLPKWRSPDPGTTRGPGWMRRPLKRRIRMCGCVRLCGACWEGANT